MGTLGPYGMIGKIEIHYLEKYESYRKRLETQRHLWVLFSMASNIKKKKKRGLRDSVNAGEATDGIGGFIKTREAW